MAPLQAPRPAAQRGDGERGGVVDIERQLGEALAGEAQFLELLACDLARSQVLGGNLCLLGKDAGRELVGAHLKAEKGDRPAVVEGAPVALVRQMRLCAIEGDIRGE